MEFSPALSTDTRGTGNGERGTVVIQTAFLGDVVLTLPLIQQLAGRFGPVDVVVTPAAAPLLTGQPTIRRVIAYDKRDHDSGVAGLRRLAGTLSAEGYARAFLPHRSLRSAVLARMAGIPQRVGFAGGVAGWIHSHRVARPNTGHESQRISALAGSTSLAPSPWLAIPLDDQRSVDAWLSQRNMAREFTLFAPGGAWPTKLWPYYSELASSIPGSIAVIGGPENQPAGEAIALAAPGRAHNSAGEFNLRQSAALIARAALVVSNDSVALHLAVALGRPVIAVVGPTGPAPGFAPIPPFGTIVAHPSLACRPCSLHGHKSCPLGHHRCMRELKVDVVLAAIARNTGGLVG